MCRLALKSADTPFSPYEVLTAMEAMQEGYDGSGLGLRCCCAGWSLTNSNSNPTMWSSPELPTPRLPFIGSPIGWAGMDFRSSMSMSLIGGRH